MADTSMVEQAKSFRNRHIGGLKRINDLLVEPEDKPDFFHYINSIVPTWDAEAGGL